jgi:hypothetical protein
MKIRLTHLITGAALAISSLCAGPVPITPAQIGPNQSVAGLTLNNAGICNVQNVGGCGGAFTATVGGIGGVTLWCVDSQEFDQANYNANIVSLQTPAVTFDNGTQVRYGSIVSSNTATTPHWLYDISGIAGVTNSDLALTRYELAAILISMYKPQQAPTDASNINNDAIQQAIWQVTENSSIAAGRNVSQGTNGQPDLGALENTLITSAASMLGTFNFGGWAVVSGGYAGGVLQGPPNAVQTYLVEVTPEPRFYGLLLVGLLSLFGIVYRRRVTS